MAKTPQLTYLVRGRVSDRFARPLPNLTVQAFDRDMRTEEMLGEALTDRQGRYEIFYTLEKAARTERQTADLSMKVLAANTKQLLYEAPLKEVRFNASLNEEINIVVETEITPQENEFDFILRTITPLIDRVKIPELTENDRLQDITFLAAETEIANEKLTYFVIAHRMAAESKGAPAFFYGLLRKNTLLKNDLASLQARLMIEINTEIRTLLYDAALTDEKLIEQDLKAAVAEYIVPESVLQELPKNLKLLKRFADAGAAYYQQEHRKRVIGLVGQFIATDKLSALKEEFQKSKDDVDGFLQRISSQSFFKSEVDEKEARVYMAAADVLGFNDELIEKVRGETDIKSPEDLKRLAALNKADWKEILTKSKVAKKADKDLVDYHASALARQMEQRFPSVAFVAQLKRETKPVLKNHDAIERLLSSREDFDLKETNIDLFLKDARAESQLDSGARTELKRVQRVFRLVPNYRKANNLLQNEIHSAQSVVALGKTRFLKEIAPQAGLSKAEATQVFKKAETVQTASMLVAGELQDTFRTMNVPALKMSLLPAKLAAVSKDFPNLKSLFQLADTCACQHCRSVYSPAAYLVEILQFLEKRTVTDLTTIPPTSNRLAKDVLFKRRPDLGEIDLGCENAETPLPYIDLVCELFEEQLAPDPGIAFVGDILADPTKNTGVISNTLLTTLQTAGLPVTAKALIFETETLSGSAAALPHYLRDEKVVFKIANNGGNNWTVKQLHQTLASAEELAAAPQYVNEAAYQMLNLAANAYAFKLPFDLNHAEAKAYFDRFGLERAMLMKNFQTTGIPADEAIAPDKLGLTDAERTLIVTADASNQQLYWNTSALTAVAEMKIVDTFLTKSGLTYEQLDILLALKFIDPTANLFIKHLDLSCDTTKKEIDGLSDNALDRMHRFLRLQKKTGFKLETTNEIISQANLGNGQLNDNCLKIAAVLRELTEETGIKIEDWICCFGEFPHTYYPRAKSTLYDSVFQNKAANGFVEEGLSAANVAANEIAIIKKPLSDFKTTLCSCLHITEDDFDKQQPLLPNTDLSFANLSKMYEIALLTRKLKLKTDDFIVLRVLTGLDPTSSAAVALTFVEAIKDSRPLPAKLADVKFMLRHEASDLANRESKDEKIISILTGLQASYQKSFAAHLSPYDDDLTAEEQMEAVERLLSGLAGLVEADAKTFTGFIDRNWVSVAAAVTFTNDKLAGLFSTTNIVNALNALAIAPGPNLEPERKDLVKAYLDTVSDYLFQTEKQNALLQALSLSFKTTVDIANIILKFAKLKQPAPGTATVSDLLLSDTLINKLNPAAPPPITPLTFPDQFRTLRLLHKLVPLIGSFKLEDSEAAWLLQNNLSLGWFELDSIPYEAGLNPIPYAKYTDLAKMLSFAKNLTAVPNPADAENPITFYSLIELLLSGSGATTAEWIGTFSLLTGYDEATLADIDNYFAFSAPNLNKYRSPATWKQIFDSAEYLRTLGVSLSQAVQFINPVLTAADTNQLQMALKARYDEELWLETLKEIMNVIRAQKRNALVTFLLATNPTMKDENDLFDYFMVDPQMESCMPSSRIVQAHGTIQLFVQRCLMGLEPEAAADTNNDGSWDQWKWMKNYRVWEANRKVFVYPENWIEPELRDDKSPIFQELEDQLLQNEVNEFTTEDGLIRYLEKLDDIAFLEVVATWYQTEIYTMHVFARTKGGDPPIYYYRKFEKERSWSPWVVVDLDITSDHLLAFVRNNRLHLAWPVVSDEPDPNPQSTIPSTDAGTVVNNDKPKRKAKIQLAISEFSNNQWKPKKLSKDAIKTPANYYTSADIPIQNFKFFYNQFAEQILVFDTEYVWVASGEFDGSWQPQQNLAGAFDVTGCKGYPELAPAKPFSLNFIPKFKDTDLLLQRYRELGADSTDDLAVLNAHAFLSGNTVDEILRATPGTFRVTYPHQFTVIDFLVLLFEWLLLLVFRSNRDKRFMVPMGTLLPYFMEDSRHAYVILPGFYGRADEIRELGLVRRTVSDVLKLLSDIIALYQKYTKKLQDDPAHDVNKVTVELNADPEYQRIVKEIGVYGTLRYGEQFKNMYHPLICPLRATLYKDGIPELMKRETQLQKTAFNFNTWYQPNPSIIPTPFPVEDIDFSSDGSYSGYNWELFFHIPFMLATRLMADQRFEEALVWFHYIFNPTGALEGNVPEKYWVTKPFYQTHISDYLNQRIDNLLYNVADPNTPDKAELEFAIDEWRKQPFKPHVIARFRPVAYQKAILMKYIQNLTEWGDYLFRQDTMESIAQATQMYIRADKLLGPKPRNIPPPVTSPYENYNQIEARLDAFGNALIDLENILPDLSVLPEGGAELPAPPITLSMLYFCVPQNDLMLDQWDTIADRLFKIRNCQNIEGVERSLALFAPPIDPGALVRAAAAGLDISSVIAGLNAPAPFYRFSVLAQRATELIQEIRVLGNSLLQALEKKDIEALSLLRNKLELTLLKDMRNLKKLQIKEATEQINILKKTKAITTERDNYYSNIEKISANEQLNLDKLSESHDYQMAAQITQAIAGVLALIPDFALGASGFGGSPHGAAKWGGSFLAHSSQAAVGVLTALSTAASYEASRASILGGYDRRFNDWQLQSRLAKKEILQIDNQTVAAEIRKIMAETDLNNHDVQIENSKTTDAFMRSKFSNQDLYQWMVGRVSSVYFRAYKLAHDLAKKAERCYQFELGNTDLFIQYGYWDNLKKGLQSADVLFYDLKRMEASYLDKNKREYELTRHVSLASLDPLALVALKATGACNFDIPEAIFDMDHPGHIFRRIKSVSVSIPAIAAPYTPVSCTLSLVKNKYRKNTAKAQGAGTPKEEYEEVVGNDERFTYNVGSIQSIATSNGQNDSGLFELNFRDDRYLPFEGCGAISSWRMELPSAVRLFDYNTISDVLLHINYTAREGGSSIRTLAQTTLLDKLAEIKQTLAETGLHLAINVRTDLPNEWFQLKSDGATTLKIGKARLPYFVQGLTVALDHVTFIAKIKNNPASFSLSVDGAANLLNRNAGWKLCVGNNATIQLDTTFTIAVAPAQLANIEELMMIVKYVVTP